MVMARENIYTSLTIYMVLRWKTANIGSFYHMPGAAGGGAYCWRTNFNFSLYSTDRMSFIMRNLWI